MKAIGDDQLERLQSEQGADDHLVETGQQQEHLPQATAPVVPDHSDDDPTVSDVTIAASRLTDGDSTPFPPRRRSDRSGYVAAPALRGRWVR